MIGFSGRRLRSIGYYFADFAGPPLALGVDRKRSLKDKSAFGCWNANSGVNLAVRGS